jgi:hypothetical protein
MILILNKNALLLAQQTNQHLFLVELVWFSSSNSSNFFLLILKGSGKTRVLTSRIAYLLKHCNVKPYEIYAVTFTNKAALEMRHRISQMLPGIQLTDMWLGTFHGLGEFWFSSIK